MASSRLYEDNSFGGRNVLIDNPGHQRYLLATYDFLNSLAFNDIDSSARLRGATAGTWSTCILFQDARFSGELRSFAYQGDRDVNALPDFNDQTSSVLLMDHHPSPNRTVLPLRQFAGKQINAAIDKQLQDIPDASRNGDVVLRFVIDLYEVSLFGVDLLLLEIPIKVHTPWPFSDYDAKIRYWVKLYLAEDATVHGHVAAWGYWISGGILTGSIEGKLKPQVQSKVGSVETQLNNMLVELNFHHWLDVYLMPSAATVDSDYGGDVNDDCTVVLPFAEGN
jgi:hypothetical protein